MLRQEGVPTVIETDLLGDALRFNNAEALFVSPDHIRARVSISVGELTQDVLIIVVEDRQYLSSGVLTGDDWFRQDFAVGFRAEDIQSEENGIGTALLSMENVELIGNEEISGGISVYHLTATVAAERVRSVTVGLMASASDTTLNADIFVRRDDTRRLARIVLTEPIEIENPDDGSITIETKTWTIDLDSYNQPFEIAEPEAVTVE